MAPARFPAPKDNAFKLDHGKQGFEGSEDLLALVVGLLQAALSHPCHTTASTVVETCSIQRHSAYGMHMWGKRAASTDTIQ